MADAINNSISNLTTENQTFYIGYNDNVVSIGLKIGKMSDSKTHQVSFNISHIAF